jgi:hypothetical protein
MFTRIEIQTHVIFDEVRYKCPLLRELEVINYQKQDGRQESEWKSSIRCCSRRVCSLNTSN